MGPLEARYAANDAMPDAVTAAAAANVCRVQGTNFACVQCSRCRGWRIVGQTVSDIRLTDENKLVAEVSEVAAGVARTAEAKTAAKWATVGARQAAAAASAAADAAKLAAEAEAEAAKAFSANRADVMRKTAAEAAEAARMAAEEVRNKTHSQEIAVQQWLCNATYETARAHPCVCPSNIPSMESLSRSTAYSAVGLHRAPHQSRTLPLPSVRQGAVRSTLCVSCRKWRPIGPGMPLAAFEGAWKGWLPGPALHVTQLCVCIK